MKKNLIFKLPAILEQFTEEQLISAVPKIELRNIYWDDMNIDDEVTYEVHVTEKLGLIYALLTGSHNPIYYDIEDPKGRTIVPGGLVMAFISAVGGCYLGGKNIFLVKKRKTFFYLPIPYGSKLLLQGRVLRKFDKQVKHKTRYYSDFCQIAYIQSGEENIKVIETGARAGILKKTRAKGEQKSELVSKIIFTLPEILNQLDEQELRHAIPRVYQPKFFDTIQIGDTVELNIQVTHKMILLFALISGDYNPLHTSPEFVKTLTAFKGKNIAHGALLSAWFSGLGVLELLGSGYRLINKDKADFKRAVKVGDEILIKLKVSDKRIQKIGETANMQVKISEKLFIKESSSKYNDAAESKSTYQLYDP